MYNMQAKFRPQFEGKTEGYMCTTHILSQCHWKRCPLWGHYIPSTLQ